MLLNYKVEFFKGENIIFEVKAKNLIGRGLFAKEFPKEFSVRGIEDTLEKLDISNVKKDEKKWTQSCSFSIPKVEHARRVMNVPTPYHQIKLAEFIYQK
ncbi:hypothetical protein ACFQIC_12170 [Halobacillus seohaensis]|uniref:Uncharacterized protein n=2 Tax=Halobacillus seohaensis TaxID=447421 RepID=A0ABW2EPY6_9BACI